MLNREIIIFMFNDTVSRYANSQIYFVLKKTICF